MKCFGVGVRVNTRYYQAGHWHSLGVGTVVGYAGQAHWHVELGPKERLLLHEEDMERVDEAFGPNYPKEIRG